MQRLIQKQIDAIRKRDGREMSLLEDCAREMKMSQDEVIREVLISTDGKIDYRKKLNAEGIENWLQRALNNARRRNEYNRRSLNDRPLPWNYYSGEW